MGNVFTSVETKKVQQTSEGIKSTAETKTGSTSTYDKSYQSLEVQTGKQVTKIADTDSRSNLDPVSTVTVNQKTTVVSTSNQTLPDPNSMEAQGPSGTLSMISIEEPKVEGEDEQKSRVKRSIISVPSYANTPGEYRLDANGRWRLVL